MKIVIVDGFTKTSRSKGPTIYRKSIILIKQGRDLNPGPQGYEDFLRK